MHLNPYTPGAQVLQKTNYAIDSHGSLAATASYLITNNFPDYATMFYTPSQHEQITSIRYGAFVNDYDSGLQEIRESLMGPAFDMYVPPSFVTNDGVGRQDEPIEIPNLRTLNKDRFLDQIQQARNEIEQAQQAMKKEPIQKLENNKVMRVSIEEETIIKKIRKVLTLRK